MKKFRVNVELPETESEFLKDLPEIERMPVLIEARAALAAGEASLARWENELQHLRASEQTTANEVAAGRAPVGTLDDTVRQISVAERMVPACRAHLETLTAAVAKAKATAVDQVVAQATNRINTLDEALTEIGPIFKLVAALENAMHQAILDQVTGIAGVVDGQAATTRLPQLSWPG